MEPIKPVDPIENLRAAVARAKIILGHTQLVTREQSNEMLADALARGKK